MAAVDPLLQSLLDSLDAPHLLLDDRRLITMNQAAERLFGAAVIGSDVSLALRHPHALELIEKGVEGTADLRGVANSEQTWRIDLRRLGGRMKLVRLEDMSATHGAERMRTDFVANASHELRTPLASIIGYAETLAEDGELPDALRARFGSAIEQEGKRMLRLVDELMSLSRISADRFVAPNGTVRLAAVIEQAVIDHRDMASRCDGQIEVAIEDDTPDIVGDLGQVSQVVDNLLSNALRYGSREGQCRIAVRVEAARGMVRMTVADEGEGIAPEHLPRLTERFYRIDPARSRDGGGTGLGLAIVKHIVERHRGTLHIRSKVGEGTEVEVQFPAR